MNAILVEFERRIERGPVKAARLLGITYAGYAAFKSGARKLPQYHFTQIRAICDRPPEDLPRYVKEYADGTR